MLKYRCADVKAWGWSPPSAAPSFSPPPELGSLYPPSLYYQSFSVIYLQLLATFIRLPMVTSILKHPFRTFKHHSCPGFLLSISSSSPIPEATQSVLQRWILTIFFLSTFPHPFSFSFYVISIPWQHLNVILSSKPALWTLDSCIHLSPQHLYLDISEHLRTDTPQMDHLVPGNKCLSLNCNPRPHPLCLLTSANATANYLGKLPAKCFGSAFGIFFYSLSISKAVALFSTRHCLKR